MRKIAKKYKNDYKMILGFKDKYYEEVFIKGLLIGLIKDREEVVRKLDDFVEKIDSWAICDSMCSSLKIIDKNKDFFYETIKKYLYSKHEFTIRVGIILLFDYYICDEYIDDIFKMLNDVKSDYYYVKMAIAWLLCECFIKQKDKTIYYLYNNKIDTFILKKALSKMHDSFRIDNEIIEKLRNDLL